MEAPRCSGVAARANDVSARHFQTIPAYVNADWEGYRTSMRSTSGGMLTTGGMVVKSLTSTQGASATSSGESELYDLFRGAAEALGPQAALADLGCTMRSKVFVDSSAALIPAT